MQNYGFNTDLKTIILAKLIRLLTQNLTLINHSSKTELKMRRS